MGAPGWVTLSISPRTSRGAPSTLSDLLLAEQRRKPRSCWISAQSKGLFVWVSSRFCFCKRPRQHALSLSLSLSLSFYIRRRALHERHFAEMQFLKRRATEQAVANVIGRAIFRELYKFVR